MDESKTIETISKFYSVVGSEEPTAEEKEFVYSFELELAKSIIKDLGNDNARKIAKIILAATE